MNNVLMNRKDAKQLLEYYHFPFAHIDWIKQDWLNAIVKNQIVVTDKEKIIRALRTLFPSKCPPVGTSFIGWKQVQAYSCEPFDCLDAIAKIEIPADARRVNNGIVNKCRCERAKVLDIFKKDNENVHYKNAFSLWKYHFVYTVGEIITPDDFDDDVWEPCSHGIHFFMTLEEAEEYVL